MTALLSGGSLTIASSADARRLLGETVAALKADRLIAYLGPGLLALEGPPAVPVLPEDVARELHRRNPAPSRIRTNMWSVAQYIESRRHRRTLRAFMADIFGKPPRPTAVHRRLAGLPLSLVIDSWYDGTLRAAFLDGGRTDFVDIQGVSRAAIGADRWFDAYDATGAPAEDRAIAAARTLLYAPHGSVAPVGNMLVADSDYVEVLTEIDIQSPIPDPVKQLRGTRGFLFLGCRFHDQMLRTYARQIIKRSAGPHYAVAEADSLTPNELKFLAAEGIVLVDLPLAEAATIITA